jgi:carbonic anhydrase
MDNYYTYNGSLTTPMCNESVRWIVFRDQMGLSQNQVNFEKSKFFKNFSNLFI